MNVKLKLYRIIHKLLEPVRRNDVVTNCLVKSERKILAEIKERLCLVLSEYQFSPVKDSISSSSIGLLNLVEGLDTTKAKIPPPERLKLGTLPRLTKTEVRKAKKNSANPRVRRNIMLDGITTTPKLDVKKFKKEFKSAEDSVYTIIKNTLYLASRQSSDYKGDLHNIILSLYNALCRHYMCFEKISDYFGDNLVFNNDLIKHICVVLYQSILELE